MELERQLQMEEDEKEEVLGEVRVERERGKWVLSIEAGFFRGHHTSSIL